MRYCVNKKAPRTLSARELLIKRKIKSAAFNAFIPSVDLVGEVLTALIEPICNSGIPIIYRLLVFNIAIAARIGAAARETRRELPGIH